MAKLVNFINYYSQSLNPDLCTINKIPLFIINTNSQFQGSFLVRAKHSLLNYILMDSSLYRKQSNSIVKSDKFIDKIMTLYFTVFDLNLNKFNWIGVRWTNELFAHHLALASMSRIWPWNHTVFTLPQDSGFRQF